MKEFLNGKKTIIGSILSLTIGFLSIKQIIDEETATYLIALSALITGIGVGHKVIKKEV